MAANNPGRTVRVIIQRAGDDSPITRRGGKLQRSLSTFSSVVAEVPSNQLESLAREPGVKRIMLDPPVISQGFLENDFASNLKTIYPQIVQATTLWDNGLPKGRQVTVGIIDTGIAPHRDLNLVDKNAIPWFGPTSSPTVRPSKLGDPVGHGTHLAGIVGGTGKGADGAYIGIAPGIGLLNLRVGNEHGKAYVSDVIEAIVWAVQNRERYNLRVLNLSFISAAGESYKTGLLNAAVEYAWFNGIVVVAAAGNGGPNTARFAPGNDPFIITVGATDDNGTLTTADDVVASFSSYGTTQDGFVKPDLVAPGRKIVSTIAPDSLLARLYPDRLTTTPSGSSYLRLSGTSASTAMVSAAAALLLQANPNWTPDQVKWVLKQTATRTSGLTPAAAGAGYLNVAAAMAVRNPPRVVNKTTPNLLLAAAYLLSLRKHPSQEPIDWENVSWENVSWENVSWENVSWENVSWENVSWENVSWENVSWENVSWEMTVLD